MSPSVRKQTIRDYFLTVAALRAFAAQLQLPSPLTARDIARAFQHEPTVAECLELQTALDDQATAILSFFSELAAPVAVGQKLLLHVSEGSTGHRRTQQIFLVPADRFRGRIAIEFCAAAIPVGDLASKFPYEDRLARILDQALLLAQPALALAQSFFDIAPFGNVDKGDYDAIDAVVNR